nr:hypothetical protein [uncultured Oscillibacter sp.]
MEKTADFQGFPGRKAISRFSASKKAKMGYDLFSENETFWAGFL